MSIILFILALAILGRGIWSQNTFVAALGFVLTAFMAFPRTAELAVFMARMAFWKIGFHGI